jgi:hypothetical protein
MKRGYLVDSKSTKDELFELATRYHEDARQEAETSQFEVVDQVSYPIEALGPILGAAARAIAEDVQAAPEIAGHWYFRSHHSPLRTKQMQYLTAVAILSRFFS